MNSPDVPVSYNKRIREYAIRVLNGGPALQIIAYCPWCGKQLPTSLREVWFERLSQLGLEPEDPAIPDEMKSDAWWKSENPLVQRLIDEGK